MLNVLMCIVDIESAVTLVRHRPYIRNERTRIMMKNRTSGRWSGFELMILLHLKILGNGLVYCIHFIQRLACGRAG